MLEILNLSVWNTYPLPLEHIYMKCTCVNLRWWSNGRHWNNFWAVSMQSGSDSATAVTAVTQRQSTFAVIFCMNVLLQDLLQVLCFLMYLYPKILKQYCCSLLLQGVFPLPPNNIAMISKQTFLPSLKVLTSNCPLCYWSLW